MKKKFEYTSTNKREEWEKHRKTYDIDTNWASVKTDEPVRFIDKLIADKAPLRMLDIGCGFGRHAVRYRKMGISVVGMDFGLEGLKQLKEKYPLVPTVCADIRHMPFNKGIADLILVNGVLYEIEDIGQVNKILEDIHGLLAEKGTFIFVHDYYPDFYKRIYSILQPFLPLMRNMLGKSARTGELKFNIWLWSRKDIKMLMRNAGFSIKKEIPCNHLFGVAHWFDYLFYKKKGQYMARSIQSHPKENIAWLGRLIVGISRRCLPYLCPATVYYEMIKDAGQK